MPEYDDDQTDDTSDESEGLRGLRSAKKAAETRAKEAEAALAEANLERREYAAIKAGLDPNNPQAAFFLAHYDGDPSAEAIKEAAVAAGFISDGSEAAREAEAAQQQMSKVFGGGENNALGTSQIGPSDMPVHVPAEEAQMWTEFDKALTSPGGFVEAARVLQRYGRDAAPVQGHEVVSGAPNPFPIS